MKTNSFPSLINCHSIFRYNNLLWYTEDDFGGTLLGQHTTYNRTANGTSYTNVIRNRHDVNKAWWAIGPNQDKM